MSKKLPFTLFLLVVLLTSMLAPAVLAQGPEPTAQPPEPAKVDVTESETAPGAETTPPAAVEADVNVIPPGWQVFDNAGFGGMWNTNDFFGVANRTNSATPTSAAAEASQSGIAWDTELWSPSLDLIGATAATLEFESNFQDYAGNGEAWVDISTDGGAGWTNLWYWTTDHGPTYETVDLTPYVGNVVILRFRYACTSSTTWYWHIDDVWVYSDLGDVLIESFEPPPAPNFGPSFKMAPDTVVGAMPISYTIVISNAGDLPALGAHMVDPFPLGTIYVPGSLTCTSGMCWEDGSAVYWTGTVGLPTVLETPVAYPLPSYLEASGENPWPHERLSDWTGDLPLTRPALDAELAAPEEATPLALTYYTDRATFDAAYPGLPTEDLEEAVIAVGGIAAMAPPLDEFTNNGIFSPGDILPGITIQNGPESHPTDGLVIVGQNWGGGTNSKIVLANFFTDGYDAIFPDDTVYAVGMDVASLLGSGTVDIEIYGPGGALLGTTSSPASQEGVFWGVYSDPPDYITRIHVYDPGGGAEGADNISFGLGILVAPNPVIIEFAVMPGPGTCGTTITNTAVISDPLALDTVVVQAWTEVWDTVLLYEDFEGAFPPAGWVVNDYAGSGVPGSVFTNTNPGGRTNLTGGSGTFAVVDDDEAGSGVASETDLWLPPMDLPPCTSTYLSFKTDYNNISTNEIAAVEVSTDGGTSWNTELLWNFDVRGPHTEMVDLGAYAGMSGVIVRFYYNDGGSWAWWWEIDDVQIVSCARQGVILVPDYQAMTACPDNLVSYTLSLENCSGISDTFDLSTTGNLWFTWIDPPVVSLDNGEMTDLTAYVDVPWDATGVDIATIIATGRGSAETDNAVLETDSAMWEWQVMAPLPQGRVFHAAAATDDYYFVIGGTSDAGGSIAVSTTYRYDIAADTWMTMTGAPAPLDAVNAAAIGDMVYVPGAAFDDNTYVYDILADSWSIISASGTFTGAIQYGVAVSGTTLYRLGGLIGNGAGGFVSTNQVWALDTLSGLWTELPPMQQDRTSFAAGSIDGNLYVAGGVHFPGFTPEMTSEMFDGTTWSYVAPVPDGGGTYTRWSYNADAVSDGNLWLMAGRRDAGWSVLDHAGYYDPATDSWTTTPDLPVLNLGRVYLQGAAGGGYVFATGGRNSAGSEIYTIHERYGNACPVLFPGIVVDAPPLETTLCPDGMDLITFTICNTGTAPLDWNISELLPPPGLLGTPFVPAGVFSDDPTPELAVTSVSPSGGAVAPAAPSPEDVLWDQPLSMTNTNAYANQDFFDPGNDPYDIFIADDFVAAEDWTIDTIFVPGNTWNPGCDLSCAYTLTWQIYADASGVPDGDPYGGGNPPLWNLALPSGDPQIVFSVGSGVSLTNVTLSLAAPANLPAGHYWLVFYPTLDFGACGCQYGRQPADTTNLNDAVVINPGGGFGFPTTWTPVTDPSTWGMAESDFSFRLEGTAGAPVDVPWLDESPTAGLIDPGYCQVVDVTFDATGMMPGEYFAGLLIESDDPDTPAITLPVTMTVDQPAMVIAVEAITDGCVVTFTGYMTGTPYIDWEWDFGAFDIFTNVNPVMVDFGINGTYPYTLTAWNDCGMEMLTGTVDVYCCDSPYNLDLNWVPFTPTVGEEVTFSGYAEGTEPIGYDWDFGDGSIGAGITATHTYTAAGDYIVVMMATNACGYDAITATITVETPCYPPADLAFDWTPLQPGIDVDVTFSGYATGTAPLVFTWDFGDGNVGAGITATHAYTAAGDYVVTMFVDNDCGSVTLTHPITVLSETVCVTVTIDYITYTQDECAFDFAAELSGDPPFTYTWDFGDGVTSTLEAPTHTYAAVGDYTVTLEVWNCEGAGYDIYTETVSCEICDEPTNLAFDWSPLQPGEGVDVLFTASADGAEPMTYDWDFGDGNLGVGITATHAYTPAGDYVVTLTVTNDCDSATITDTITVFTETICVPVEIITVSTDIVACQVTFAPDYDGDTPFTYRWDFGDGNTDSVEMPVHTYAEPGGTFTVTLTMGNCEGTGSDDITFAVTVDCEPELFYIYLPLVFKAHEF